MAEDTIEEVDDKKEEEEDSEAGFVEMVRKNPFIASTIVLGLIVLVMLVSSLIGTTGGVITGGVVGTDDVEGIFLNYLDGVGANIDDVEIVSVEKKSGVYEITFNYQGEAYPVPYYVTLDGSLIGVLTEISSEEASSAGTSGVPQADRPVVELFIWGYCPYGVQAQEPLAEVAELLGDYADFKAVLYYDGHGAFETQQNKIQECIQQIAPEKYWAYAAGFAENIYPKCGSSRDVSCDKAEAIKLMTSLGIATNEVLDCVDSQGEELLSAASSYASSLGVSGSPTIVINGAKANPSSRTAEAFKDAVCSSFTDDNVPEACAETLSSDAAAASGNC